MTDAAAGGDPTLFAGCAAYYERGRLPYAPGLASILADTLEPERRRRLLDVGCGPGIVTLALAPHFAEATGLDPDPDMIEAARRRAARLEITGVRWLVARAEDLPVDIGRVDMVVFAQSFHWTDRDRVAATVWQMLEPGGILAHIAPAGGDPSSPAPEGPRSTSHPAPPQVEIDELVRRYLGPVRRAGQGTRPHGTPAGEEQVLHRAGFVDRVRTLIPAEGPGSAEALRDADDVVADVLSRSYSAPHLFADRRAEFERDLRDLLHRAAPDAVFAVPLPATELTTWRRPAESS